jgi:branched-chain amino acid transport system permease protein
VALGLLPVLVAGDPYFTYVGGTACLLALLATSWGLMASAGVISFGHAGFFGAGAYGAALAASRLGLSPWISLGAGGAVAALAAAPLTWSCQRVHGPYLALTTLAHAEVLRVLVQNWTGLTGGAQGLVGLPGLALPWPAPAGVDPRVPAYYSVWLLLAAGVAGAAALRHGPFGYALDAVRESEARAAALGVSPAGTRAAALGLGAFLAGLAGGAYAFQVHFLEPGLAFGISFSVLPLVMAMFGGRLHPAGPVVGALALHGVNELLFQRLVPRGHLLLFGLVVIGVVARLPDGLLPRRARAAVAP